MDSVHKGNTGEFYVLAELSRQGWIVAQTPRGSRAYDILGRKGDRQIGVRVKTKTADSKNFQWNAKKNGEVFLDIGANDYCVLVDIPNEEAPPTFYVVPTREIRDWLAKDFKEWVQTPGPRKAQRDPTNTRRLIYLDDDETALGHGYLKKLRPYRNGWALLLTDGSA